MSGPVQNLQNRLKKLSRLIANPQTQTRVGVVVMTEVLGEMQNRIFKDGEAADGSKIGNYSTKPIYQNKKNLIGLPESKMNPLGKNRKSKFKNGKTKKTRHLPQGYKELRDRTGRQSKTVDLNLTGASSDTIKVGQSGDGVVIGFTNPERRDILRANEKKYKKDIFSLSKSEKTTMKKTTIKELEIIINEIINQ